MKTRASVNLQKKLWGPARWVAQQLYATEGVDVGEVEIYDWLGTETCGKDRGKRGWRMVGDVATALSPSPPCSPMVG